MPSYLMNYNCEIKIDTIIYFKIKWYNNIVNMLPKNKLFVIQHHLFLFCNEKWLSWFFVAWFLCSDQGPGFTVGGHRRQERPLLCVGASQRPSPDSDRVQNAQPRVEQNLHLVRETCSLLLLSLKCWKNHLVCNEF